MKTFNSQLCKIIEINKKIIKNIKKQLRQNENCKTVEIGFYQKFDFELWLVLKIGEKEFSTDISLFEGYHEGLVELKSFVELNACLRSTVRSVKKRELVNILEWTLVANEVTYSKNSDTVDFVGEALKLCNATER